MCRAVLGVVGALGAAALGAVVVNRLINRSHFWGGPPHLTVAPRLTVSPRAR